MGIRKHSPPKKKIKNKKNLKYGVEKDSNYPPKIGEEVKIFTYWLNQPNFL